MVKHGLKILQHLQRFLGHYALKSSENIDNKKLSMKHIPKTETGFQTYSESQLL